MKYKVVQERVIGYAMNYELALELLNELREKFRDETDYALKLEEWDGK